MNKRLLKRHKRQDLRARDRVRLSEPDLRTPEQLREARDTSHPSGAMIPIHITPRRQFENTPVLPRTARRKLTFNAMLRATVGAFSTRCAHCRSVDFRTLGVRNAIERALHWLLQPYRCSLFVVTTFSCSDGKLPSAARHK